MNVVSSRRSGFYRHGYHLGAESSRVPGYYQHGGHLGAHRAGGFYDHTLGQFDPSSGITGDIMFGPEEPAPPPDFTDPNITYGPGSGAPQNAPAPSVSVPRPPTSIPGFTFPSNTVANLFPQGLPPGPSPRVNVPLSPTSAGMWLSNKSLLSGVPNWLVLGGGLLAIPLIGGLLEGGRRRRR